MKALPWLALASVAAAAPTVTKVEPPNWWPGHSINPVHLLIHGTGLNGARVSAPGGLTAANVRTNENGTYVFVDLTIPAASKPGDYPLQINTASGSVTASFRLDASLPAAGRFQGFSPDDVIYLLMPDRFANGDPSNDNPAQSPGLFDRKNPHMYHGGDFQGIINHLPYLKSLGVTAIWMTPVYDNTNEPNTQQAVNGAPIADYHGYGATDYYAVEEHFGTMQQLRELVDDAHDLHLKVIEDQVANHVGPGHPWVKDPPKPTWFHGTPAHHINETWQIWTVPDLHASNTLRTRVLNGWFADVLPDLNQEDPDVAQYEIQNALWWVGMAGFDGIRQDTLPYVPRSFWHDWSAALKRQYPSLRTVGEVFDANPAVPSFFQGGVKRWDGIDSGVDSVFDFPTYFSMRDVLANGAKVDMLSKNTAEDRLYPDPNVLVTFLGNHDVRRFLNESGASIERLKLAFAMLLSFRGTPCIYYGDEIGMHGGDDPDNRRDFPGGWPDDPRNAFTAEGRTPQENAIWDYVHKLTTLRAQHNALRNGKLTELAVADHAWVYARQSDRESAIVAINNGQESVDIPVAYQDGTYSGELRIVNKLEISNGVGTIHLPPTSAEIFLNQK
ncbi:MAG: cyclomaltodextrinase N-terminal domain-containing protein [Acidobacteriaceae bacterium]|nr:cyclomaltodextrinase N-terminal domain-containing protein [Acidobacteriaceae bacterium]